MDGLRDDRSPSFLQKTTPTLLLWDPARALPDMSSLCLSRKVGSGLGGGRSHCRGTVQSLRNWREAWLAYTVNTQARYGSIELHTSSNRLLVDVRRDAGARGRREAFITIDGKPLGSMRLESRKLLDRQSQPIGCLTGGRTFLMQGMTDYRTLEMGGREIAEINDEPLARLERLGPTPPAFRIHQPRLSPDEEWWLVALLAIAIYANCLSSDV